MKDDYDAQSRINQQLLSGGGTKAVTSASVFRDAMERQSLAEVKASGARPPDCGDSIVDVAPARGPVRRFMPMEVARTENGNYRARKAGEFQRDGTQAHAIQRVDAFDKMEAQAARRRKNRDDTTPLFTRAQVAAGRTYSALFERHAAAGAKCSSLETMGGGSGGGSFIDAVLADGRRLDEMRHRIGAGHAVEPKRVAPHGDRRRAIRVIDLVHLVCVAGLTLSEVLERYGWAGNLRNRTELRKPLCAALDRIRDC